MLLLAVIIVVLALCQLESIGWKHGLLVRVHLPWLLLLFSFRIRLWVGLIKFNVVLVSFASDIVLLCCAVLLLLLFVKLLLSLSLLHPATLNMASEAIFSSYSFDLIQLCSSSFVRSFVYKLKTITVSCNTKYCATKHTHAHGSDGRFFRFVLFFSSRSSLFHLSGFVLLSFSFVFPFYRVSMPLHFLSFSLCVRALAGWFAR